MHRCAARRPERLKGDLQSSAALYNTLSISLSLYIFLSPHPTLITYTHLRYRSQLFACLWRTLRAGHACTLLYPLCVVHAWLYMYTYIMGRMHPSAVLNLHARATCYHPPSAMVYCTSPPQVPNAHLQTASRGGCAGERTWRAQRGEAPSPPHHTTNPQSPQQRRPPHSVRRRLCLVPLAQSFSSALSLSKPISLVGVIRPILSSSTMNRRRAGFLSQGGTHCPSKGSSGMDSDLAQGFLWCAGGR
jgi:hypothetical protein